jgi:hypothetical protein
MKDKPVSRPDSVSEQTWADNQNWLQLMTKQAEQHRHSQDPRLYRKSSQGYLITPPQTDKS